MPTADKLNKAVSTWQKSNSHSARISRSRYYYEPHKEVRIQHPYYGYPKIWREINEHGTDTTEATVRRVMRRFGITAIFPGRNLSKACKYHKKYPYPLKNKIIRYPNHVWPTDITYIKLPISMDAKDRASDNIRLERLWRSL